MKKHRKYRFLLTAFAFCSAVFFGCSSAVPAPVNRTLICYRKGSQTGSSFIMDGTLYYAGDDGVYDQENKLILRTEAKPLLLLCGNSIFTADGTTVTEYDRAFQKQTEYQLPEEPSAFAVSENSIFYTNAEHVPHVSDKQTGKAVPECKAEISIPSIPKLQGSILVQYYPDFTVLSEPDGAVTAFDMQHPDVCVSELQEHSSTILSVSDERILYTPHYLVTSLELLSCALSDPEQVETFPTDGVSNLEQFLCGENEIVLSGVCFPELSKGFSREDLREHQADCYFKFDTKDMHIISQHSTRQYERILYADADKYVVLHGRELQTRSAETGKQQSMQETDLFMNGGYFTIETGPDTIYVFDNETGKIAEIFSVS